MAAIQFTPPCGEPVEPRAISVESAEALLSQWFARPVLLTSSGRAALWLCFQELGLNRYASRMAMPPRTAQCVLDVVVRAAFPIDPATDNSPVDATLLIHQYGHLLKDRPTGPVVEDICHAFFATAETGARDWAGDMAIFSLPKFFSMAGMCGGIVASSEELADRLRSWRDEAKVLDAGTIEADQAAWRASNSAHLEELYLRALLHPACSPAALSGLPADIESLRNVGKARELATQTLLDAIPKSALDDEWRAMCSASLPFALPVFARSDQFKPLIDAFSAKGVGIGEFRINFSRSMKQPVTRPALLLPCHSGMSAQEVKGMSQSLKSGLAA